MKKLIKFFQGKMVDKELLDNANKEIELLNKSIKKRDEYADELLIRANNFEIKYNKVLENNQKHQIQNEILKNENNSLMLKIKELKNKNRKANSGKGGFISQINKLTKQLEESTKKYEEFTKNKFIVKKVVPAIPRKSKLEMGIKRGCTKVQVKKELKEKNKIMQ